MTRHLPDTPSRGVRPSADEGRAALERIVDVVAVRRVLGGAPDLTIIAAALIVAASGLALYFTGWTNTPVQVAVAAGLVGLIIRQDQQERRWKQALRYVQALDEDRFAQAARTVLEQARMAARSS